ncbi:MAG: lysophospholipid acyltransferase family protein [Chitinophagaceae bacterium]|nr:lysophospholipid acyltransferase family protein [Chitinophagaceae bacterium]
MPFPILYFVSDIFYVVLYHIIGYRKKVVMHNLRNSFPQKTELELSILQKQFYRYFCDLFLETLKTLTISKDAMLRHCSISKESVVLLNKLATEGKSILLVMGHQGNWEWAGNTFSIVAPHQLYVIYHPLGNRHFDKLMYKMRTRFGTKLIPMKDTFKSMMRNKNELSATAFIADQTPQPQSAHWLQFLHQETPVFLGAEKIALKMNRLAMFVSVKKIKRGYYELCVNEKGILRPETFTREGAFTEAHTLLLENEILKQPETWLWTHRRWKHKKK